MGDHVEDKNVKVNLLHYLPPEDSVDRIEALWRQVMVFKAFSDNEVVEAKTRRGEAEAARDRAEQEAAESTRQLCESLKSEADRQVVRAQESQAKAERLHLEARRKRDRADELVKEAEAAGVRIVSEAQQRAQETLDEARKTAHRECAELRHQALKEIRAILARVESVKEATDEELETQRIFSNIARLKANSTSMLARPAGPDDGDVAAIHAQESPEASLDGAETESRAEDTPEQVPVMTASSSSNGKSSAASGDKPSRRQEHLPPRPRIWRQGEHPAPTPTHPPTYTSSQRTRK